MTQQRVLIVDDDRRIGSYISRLARKEKSVVSVITRPNLFYKEYETFEPNVIFLDLNMPNIDGIELLRFLQKVGSKSDICLMSGVHYSVVKTVADMASTMGLNLIKVLGKPFNSSDVTDVLHQSKKLDHSAQINSPGRVRNWNACELNAAIKLGHIIPYYQPKFDLAKNTMVGVEALCRWFHPEYGMIMPDEFIPLAEDTGLIVNLTNHMLSSCLKDLVNWDLFDPSLQLSINISPSLLSFPDYTNTIEEYVKEAGVDPKRIILEITESLTMGLVTTMEVLSRLRIKGFNLSIDDYGTGFSSLEKLYKLPFTEIKIDKTFVMDALENEYARAIVISTIELGRKFGLTIVAEGIENSSVRDFLQRQGCNIGQGFYMGKPVDSEQISLMINSVS